MTGPLGLQVPNRPEAFDRPVLRALARLRPRQVLFLGYAVEDWAGLGQHSALAARLRARGSGTLLRCYARDIPQRDPAAWAAECARRATVFYAAEAGEVIPGNEMNWPGQAEGGHEDYARHRAWFETFAETYRSLRPRDRLHLPAPWGGWVGEGGERAAQYWQELLPVIPRFDVVDVHAYGEGWGLHQRCRELLDTAGVERPMLVSECNRVPFDRLAREVAGLARLEGTVYFILDSPDEVFGQFSLLRDPGLMAAYAGVQRRGVLGVLGAQPVAPR